MQNIGTTSVVLVAAIGIAIVPFATATASDNQGAQAPVTSNQQWSATFAEEVRLFTWRSNAVPGFPVHNGGRGTELYIPYALQLTGKPTDKVSVDIVGRGGWVRASQGTPGLSGSVAATTDTVFSATATYLGFDGVQPFVALQSNVPTGRSQLFGNAANARMDPDLVDLATFGEGFNIGPTLGLALPVSKSLIFTASAGYTWRGALQTEANVTAVPPIVQTLTSIDPGDDLTITGAANFKAGSLSGNLTGSFTRETATSQFGLPVFRAGDRYLAAAALSYAWAPNLGTTTLTASAAHANHNDSLNLFQDALIREVQNSNSNVFRLGLQHLFPIGAFSAGPTGSVLFRDHNGYDATTLQFVPSKQRWSAGVLAQYSPSPSVTLNARVEGVWIHEAENPAEDDAKFSVTANGFVPAFTVPAISGTALQMSLGINVKN
jgi:hypothetical protein